MLTQTEAVTALLAAVVALLTALVVLVWRARGWIDRLNTTDGNLAAAIDRLAETQREIRRQDQDRFARIERRLDARGDAAPGRARR